MDPQMLDSPAFRQALQGRPVAGQAIGHDPLGRLACGSHEKGAAPRHRLSRPSGSSSPAYRHICNPMYVSVLVIVAG